MFVSTVGINEKIIRKYVEMQGKEEGAGHAELELSDTTHVRAWSFIQTSSILCSLCKIEPQFSVMASAPFPIFTFILSQLSSHYHDVDFGLTHKL